MGPARRCPVPQVEEPVGPGVVVAATACPMDTKDRLDRRNQETEGVAATEREVGRPMVMATLASAVDSQQVVVPTRHLMHRFASRWLRCRRSRTDPGREGAGQRR